MKTDQLRKLPQAVAFLDRLKAINPGYQIKIIEPKKRWPDIETRKLPKVMDIIRQHHIVSIDGLGRDIGLEAIVQRSRDTDLWIHILDENGKLIGFSINEVCDFQDKLINFFRVTIFSKSLQKHGIYALMNELKLAIISADILLVRTQNPIVYKYFTQMCEQKRLKVSPKANYIDPASLDIARQILPQVDEFSVERGVLKREALKGTPKPPEEYVPIWDRMDIYNGDVVVIIGYPE